MIPSSHSTERTFNNLPIQLTSFIGREKEIAEIERLLATTRLLTLTGAGGCGKTRLALAVATAVLDEFDDGVWFIDLAPLSDPALVLPAVASALELTEAAGRPMIEILLDYVRERKLLLLLDNCEHLITACAQMADQLLRASSELQILATSREPLGIAGETTLRVPSLALPDPSAKDLRDFTQSEAVRLFTDRASAVLPTFQLTTTNASFVAQICNRLDGIPLAIELAAARVRALSIEEIAVRIDDRFRLLTLGSRTALLRHQTLRATIDWSYELLTEPERILFRRVSVFAGGFTLEAAEAVCHGDRLAPSQILDVLARLIDKSLVVAEGQNGQTRYHMLETVRQYACTKLDGPAERDALQNRHLEYFLQQAEEAEPHLTSSGRDAWMVRLEADHDNLRAALEWTEIIADQRSRLRLAGALAWFWRYRDYASEGMRWLECALADGDYASAAMPEERALRAKALLGTAGVARGTEVWTTTRARIAEAIALYEEIGDRRGLAHALLFLGALVGHSGNQFAAARPILEQSVTLLRALLRENPATGRQTEDRWWLAFALSRLGEVIHHNDLASARPILEEGLALARELGDHWLLGQGLMILGSVVTKLGDWASGRVQFEEALALFRHVGPKDNMGWALGALGDIARYEGDYRQAARFYTDGLSLYREGDSPDGISWMLYSLGCVALHDEAGRRATEFFAESLALRKKLDHREGMAEVLDGLAGVAAVNEQPQRAVRLFGAAQAVRESMQDVIRSLYQAPSDPYLPMAGAQLDQAAFKSAWDEGHAMTLEQAIEYALQTTSPSNTVVQPAPSTHPAGLTEREVEVLRWLARGLSNPEIADQLVLSRRTVDAHLRSIYGKLGVTTRNGATRVAIENKII